MIKLGDTIKIIGTTLCGDEEKECIPIGTVCEVVGIENREKEGLILGVIPQKELPYSGYGEYWYLARDIEKGRMEWVKETEESEDEQSKD